MTRKHTRTQKQPSQGGKAYSAQELAAIARAKVKAVGFQGWQPKHDGDAIAGTIVAIEKVKGKFGEFNTYKLDGPNGVIGLPSGVVMDSAMQAIKARPGVKVAVVYRGSVKGKKGRPARLFAVEKIG